MLAVKGYQAVQYILNSMYNALGYLVQYIYLHPLALKFRRGSTSLSEKNTYIYIIIIISVFGIIMAHNYSIKPLIYLQINEKFGLTFLLDNYSSTFCLCLVVVLYVKQQVLSAINSSKPQIGRLVERGNLPDHRHSTGFFN